MDVAGLGWRICFLINVPVGLAALAAARLVPESRAPGRTGLDLTGTALLTAGLAAVLVPLIEGRAQGWPAWTWASLAGAAVLLGAFAARQRRLAARGGDPLLDPALLRSRAFGAAMATQTVFWCSAASFFLVLALYLQDGRGLTRSPRGSCSPSWRPRTWRRRWWRRRWRSATRAGWC